MKKSLKILVITISTCIFFSQSYAQELPCKSQYYDKKCKERYLEDSEGQIHGKFISYNEDGSVKLVAYYSHGKYNGTVTEYLSSAKIITTYLNGIKHGLYQRVDNDGDIKDKGNYNNGLKTGPWIEYYKDKGSYVNGEKHGPWQIYQTGWQCDGGVTTGSFDNGKHVGVWLNLVVIGTKKPSQLVLNNQKEIAFPATTGYIALEEYYKLGYKSVFDKDGYYIDAFDANGNQIKPQ